MDRLTGKGAERKGTAVSVMEIKEAVGKLSPEELAEVSAFIEGREADWLEQCGRTADERLRVKSWKVRTAAAGGDFISEKIFRGRERRFEFSQLVGTGAHHTSLVGQACSKGSCPKATSGSCRGTGEFLLD
jgi:hypothetical protein